MRTIILPAMLFCLALISATLFHQRLEDSLLGPHQKFPMALAGSPYGQLLARMAKIQINLLWHSGQVRVTEEDHHHDHGHEGDAHDHNCPPSHGTRWWGNWIDQMLTAKSKRTNPFGVSALHQQYLKRQIEKEISRAYAMDPTDYTIYVAYFMRKRESGSPGQWVGARQVARNTLKMAQMDDVSPAPWLTATAAALDLIMLKMEEKRVAQGKEPSQAAAVIPDQDMLALAGRLFSNYERLKKIAQVEGRWEKLSEERREELEGYAANVSIMLQRIREVDPVTGKARNGK